MHPIDHHTGNARLRSAVVACGLALALAGAGCGSSSSSEPEAGLDEPGNIVEIALDSPDFSILVEAVVAADLQGFLAGDGPFTVFAPTNDAFAGLLGELGVTKEQLLADVPLLTAVLSYHVLGAEVPAAAVPLGAPIPSLQGGFFKIDVVDEDLVITDGRNRQSTILATDVEASNGVIHVIDRVILPADRNLVETAVAAAGGDPAEFTILVAAVLAADLDGALSGPGPFTVFAPTDAAFLDLLAELGVSAEDLLASTELLTTVLTYHVVPDLVLAAQVPIDTPIDTLQGDSFAVNANLAITDQRGRTAQIVATDILAMNGVIHVIDRVILPAP